MEEDSVSPSAEIVAQAFARQYYAILQHSPGLVYRFYQDTSKLGRTEADGGMGLTTTMEAINEKITSYGSLKVDIKSVDAQPSYKGGVIVVMTGDLINKDDSRRTFVQTFFLAPQQTGYFVLNDIFRFIGESDAEKPLANGVVPQPSQDPAASPVLENAVSGKVVKVNGATHCLAENGEATNVQMEDPMPHVVDEVPSEPLVSVPNVEEVPLKKHEELPKKKHDEGPKQQEELAKKSYTGIPKKSDEDMPKKSYASIVLVSTVQAPTSPENFPKIQDDQAAVAAPLVSVDIPVSGSNVDEGRNHEGPAGEGYSIYLKNLPFNVTYQMIEKTFSSFGLIKNDSIQIRKNKGFCFGFVDFESPDAVRDAIKASPVTIDGHPVGVEAKKSTGSRVGNRGRFSFSGRGGYRNEGGRARGSYGGRGYGRGDFNRNDFGNRGNYRGYQNRGGDGYTDNETGHSNRSGGLNSDIAARPQRVFGSA